MNMKHQFLVYFHTSLYQLFPFWFLQIVAFKFSMKIYLIPAAVGHGLNLILIGHLVLESHFLNTQSNFQYILFISLDIYMYVTLHVKKFESLCLRIFL